MSVKFKFLGLEAIGRIIARIRAKARQAEALEMFSEEVRLKLRDTIEKQGFRHASLSLGWTKKKRYRGLDARILIASSEYVNSFYTGKTARGFFVTTPARFSSLAGWLEFGTKRMVARPHWRPIMVWAEGQWGRVAEQFGKDLLK